MGHGKKKQVMFQSLLNVCDDQDKMDSIAFQYDGKNLKDVVMNPHMEVPEESSEDLTASELKKKVNNAFARGLAGRVGNGVLSND